MAGDPSANERSTDPIKLDGAPVSPKIDEYVPWLRMLIAFSQSGVFFILLGCGFLATAYSVFARVHPTFVFILALLGLSIVLFGTGTQSLGSGELSEPGSKAKAKFYLAGGAGVLAGIFGFGAVLGSEKIERVFLDAYTYALVEIEIENPGGADMQRATFKTQQQDGHNLPLVIQDKSIVVLVPVQRRYVSTTVCIDGMSADKKWSIGKTCPTLDLIPNSDGSRPEPVQRWSKTKVNIDWARLEGGVDERGSRVTPTQTPVQFEAR